MDLVKLADEAKDIVENQLNQRINIRTVEAYPDFIPEGGSPVIVKGDDFYYSPMSHDEVNATLFVFQYGHIFSCRKNVRILNSIIEKGQLKDILYYVFVKASFVCAAKDGKGYIEFI